MRPLYDARISDLGPNDRVKIECLRCPHSASVTGEAIRLHLPDAPPLLASSTCADFADAASARPKVTSISRSSGSASRRRKSNRLVARGFGSPRGALLLRCASGAPRAAKKHVGGMGVSPATERNRTPTARTRKNNGLDETERNWTQNRAQTERTIKSIIYERPNAPNAYRLNHLHLHNHRAGCIRGCAGWRPYKFRP